VSNVPKLDDFHYHEMLDRLHVMMCNVDTHLLQHPVCKIDTKIKNHVNSAMNELCEAYQMVSTIEIKLNK